MMPVLFGSLSSCRPAVPGPPLRSWLNLMNMFSSHDSAYAPLRPIVSSRSAIFKVLAGKAWIRARFELLRCTPSHGAKLVVAATSTRAHIKLASL